MRRWAEFVAALTLLTRLPVAGWAAAHPPPAECVWAYPVIGAVVGTIGAAVFSGALAVGMPQPLAAIWVLAAIVLVTGALHEDGLADTADGFGGGRTAERKLAIMRDSRIGSYGAIALLFSFTLRALPLSMTGRPVAMLLAASVLGRAAILLPLLLARPARPDGLAASLGGGRLATPLLGLAIALGAAIFVPWAGVAALTAGTLLGVAARQQLGGYTGDVLGAAEQVGECFVMTVLATRLG